jgi:hypothetical protein
MVIFIATKSIVYKRKLSDFYFTKPIWRSQNLYIMSKTPLTRYELARAYGISIRTFYNWSKELQIPANRRISIIDCELIFEKYGKPAGIWEVHEPKHLEHKSISH